MMKSEWFERTAGGSARSIPASVNATVPVVRAAARVDVEFLTEPIDFPFQIAVLQLRDGIDVRALEVQVPDEKSAQMRRVGYAAGFAERREDGDGAQDGDAQPRRHPEHDQQDRALREIDRIREQQSVDRAGGADDVDVLQRPGEPERQQ